MDIIFTFFCLILSISFTITINWFRANTFNGIYMTILTIGVLLNGILCIFLKPHVKKMLNLSIATEKKNNVGGNKHCQYRLVVKHF